MDKRPVYWDSSIITHYIQETPEYIDRLDVILHRARAGEGGKILTSTLSIAEVAGIIKDRHGKTVRMVDEASIDLFFGDRSVVVLAEFIATIARRARALLRAGAAQNRARPGGADAAHLATALVHNAIELHTTDGRFLKLDGHVGMTICEPPVPTGILPMHLGIP